MGIRQNPRPLSVPPRDQPPEYWAAIERSLAPPQQQPPSTTPRRPPRSNATRRGVYNWKELPSFAASARDFWSQVVPGSACVLDVSPLQYRVDAHLGSPDSRADPASWANETTMVRCRATERACLRNELERGRDCLHWCVPGALSIVPQLLLNLLELEREKPRAPGSGECGAHHRVR